MRNLLNPAAKCALPPGDIARPDCGDPPNSLGTYGWPILVFGVLYLSVLLSTAANILGFPSVLALASRLYTLPGQIVVMFLSASVHCVGIFVEVNLTTVYVLAKGIHSAFCFLRSCLLCGVDFISSTVHRTKTLAVDIADYTTSTTAAVARSLQSLATSISPSCIVTGVSLTWSLLAKLVASIIRPGVSFAFRFTAAVLLQFLTGVACCMVAGIGLVASGVCLMGVDLSRATLGVSVTVFCSIGDIFGSTALGQEVPDNVICSPEVEIEEVEEIASSGGDMVYGDNRSEVEVEGVQIVSSGEIMVYGPQPVAPATPAYPADVVFLTFTRFDLVSAFAYAYYPICRPILATWASIPGQETVVQQHALIAAVPTEQVVYDVPIQRPTLLLTWIPASVDVDVLTSVGDLEATIVELDNASCDDGLSAITSEWVEDEDSVSVHGSEAEAADPITEVTVYGPHRVARASLAYPTDVVFLNFTCSDLLSAFAYAYYPISIPIVGTSTLVADQAVVAQQGDNDTLTIAVPIERPVDEVSIRQPTLLLTWIPAPSAVDDSATVGELEATIEELDPASSDDDLILATPKFMEDCSTSALAQVTEAAVAVERDEIMVYGPRPHLHSAPVSGTDAAVFGYTPFDILAAYAYTYYPVQRIISTTFVSFGIQEITLQRDYHQIFTVPIPGAPPANAITLREAVPNSLPLLLDSDADSESDDLSAVIVESDSSDSSTYSDDLDVTLVDIALPPAVLDSKPDDMLAHSVIKPTSADADALDAVATQAPQALPPPSALSKDAPAFVPSSFAPSVSSTSPRSISVPTSLPRYSFYPPDDAIVSDVAPVFVPHGYMWGGYGVEYSAFGVCGVTSPFATETRVDWAEEVPAPQRVRRVRGPNVASKARRLKKKAKDAREAAEAQSRLRDAFEVSEEGEMEMSSVGEHVGRSS